MKKEIKDRNSSIMISDFQDAIVAIESLAEYYQNSVKNVHVMKMNIEKEYEIGLIVDSKLKECIVSKENGTVSEKIASLLNMKLESGEKVSDYIQIECELKEESLRISYTINENKKINAKYIDPQNARREYNKVEQYENILISSTLSTVIIIFEQFLTKLYEALIIISPQKYFENQKIEIANIFNKDVKEVVVECVKKEVESNMFDSINALEKISKKENININRFINIQDEFEEIYFRRNLYIHNNGFVNKKYLENIKERYRKNLTIGHKLITDEIYLRNAINTLYKIVCTIFFEVQFSYHPKYEKWSECLSEIAFELLKNKNYVVAEHIYFILSSCRAFCFRDKAMYKINYINSLKQQGKKEEVEKELENLDVSIATDDFKIAKLWIVSIFFRKFNFCRLAAGS